MELVMGNLNENIAQTIKDDVVGTVFNLDNMPQKINNNKWYETMIKDLDDALFATRSTIEIVKIKSYHSIGSYINIYKDDFEKMGLTGRKMADKIAKSLNTNHVYIYDAMNFASEFPDFDKIPLAEVKSWNHLRQKFLKQEKDEKVTKEKRCPHCDGVL